MYNIGASVTKVFNVRNCGEGPWPSDCVLALTKGDVIDFPQPVIPPLTPGSSFELELKFTVPAYEQNQKHVWRIQTPAGKNFGPKFVVKYSAIAVAPDMTED
jgi:hypothetical protein